ncbi:MAG: helix-turn-helix transcriptional regulator [Geminicoccaceae bacterium]
MDNLPNRGASEEHRRHIAVQINQRIRELGINQSELARKINTSRDNVSGWCRGTSCPRGPMMYRLAAALNCTVSDLIPENLLKAEQARDDSLEASYDPESNTMRVRMDIQLPMAAAVELMALVNKAIGRPG